MRTRRTRLGHPDSEPGTETRDRRTLIRDDTTFPVSQGQVTVVIRVFLTVVFGDYPVVPHPLRSSHTTSRLRYPLIRRRPTILSPSHTRTRVTTPPSSGVCTCDGPTTTRVTLTRDHPVDPLRRPSTDGRSHTDVFTRLPLYRRRFVRSSRRLRTTFTYTGPDLGSSPVVCPSTSLV